MVRHIIIDSTLVRALARERGGTYMAIAAALTAALPGHYYDKGAIGLWTGWDDAVVDRVRTLMRERGWLDQRDQLCGLPAELLTGQGSSSDDEDYFVKSCQYIAERRGIRYLPTPSRRKDFMAMARKHGARTVYEVVRHRVNRFMTATAGSKSMAQYARLETILRPSNFEKYLSEYEDERP